MCIYLHMDKTKLIQRQEARFWSKVDRKGENDCWNWLAGKDLDGYGVFYDFNINQNKRAHRIAWKFANKNEPQLLILHKCDNPACVNPSHLFEGTHTDNMRDKSKKGRWKGNPENLIEINGVVKTLGEWSKISGINKKTIWRRIKAGYNTQDAVFARHKQKHSVLI